MFKSQYKQRKRARKTLQRNMDEEMEMGTNASLGNSSLAEKRKSASFMDNECVKERLGSGFDNSVAHGSRTTLTKHLKIGNTKGQEQKEKTKD